MAAQRELVTTCNFSAMENEILRDQIVEKTCLPRIRERLLLEPELTLDRALTLARRIEIAVADAKTFTESGTKLVSAVYRQGNKKAGNPKVKYKQKGENGMPPVNNATCVALLITLLMTSYAQLKKVNAKHVGR